MAWTAPLISDSTAEVSSPVPSRSPFASRPYLAPFGSGVSRVSPARWAAAELKYTLCPELWMITNGVSGAVVFSQSSVGSGRPACSSGSQPTRYAPSAPRVATSRVIASTTATGSRTVTGRMSTMRSDSTIASIIGCPCASMSPGITQPSPMSSTCVSAPISGSMPARVPMATSRPSVTASASAVGVSGSTVRTVPWMTRSAEGTNTSSEIFPARCRFASVRFDVSTRARWTGPVR